ncbi:UNVERIFIED_CONTAM: hypothetical protein Slati_2916600 [Sesamum latifolium]|uniref:Uncharacterized protein n=1 Tax=Sesamum latifolium TaxID=2727402 RepID=A0AAW2VDU9_9LAMI
MSFEGYIADVVEHTGIWILVNKALHAGIKKRLERVRGNWTEKLTSILWAYRTTPRGSTGESPFSLVYETEAVTPAELGMPSHRIVNFSEECNTDFLKESLDLIEELREKAFTRVGSSFVLQTSKCGERNTFRNINRSIRGTSKEPSLAARDSFFLVLLPSFAPDVPLYGFSCCCRGNPSLPPPLRQGDYPDPPLQKKEQNQITLKETGMTPDKAYENNNKHTYPTLEEDPPQQKQGDWQMGSALEGRQSAHSERRVPHQHAGMPEPEIGLCKH